MTPKMAPNPFGIEVSYPRQIKGLFAGDISISKAMILADKCVRSGPMYDFIISGGKFLSSKFTGRKMEESAIIKADFSTALAQLENIVCRVLYQSDPSGPHDMMSNECHLTPSSLNVYARCVPLLPNLKVMAFGSTTQKCVEEGQDNDISSGTLLQEDALQIFIANVEDILVNMIADREPGVSPEHSHVILLLDFDAPFVDELLFILAGQIKEAGIKMLIVSGDIEYSCGTNTVRDVTILPLASLADDQFNSVEFTQHCEDGPWESKISVHDLK